LIAYLHPRYLLSDIHCNAPNVRQAWGSFDRFLIVPQYGTYSYTGVGKEVRRILHELRSTAIENLNEQFKGIFDVMPKCQPKAWSTPDGLHWGPFLFINLPCCIDLSMAWTYGLDSRLF
jgi:hypothetical protein